jgi:hypothetical protein
MTAAQFDQKHNIKYKLGLFFEHYLFDREFTRGGI